MLHRWTGAATMGMPLGIACIVAACGGSTHEFEVPSDGSAGDAAGGNDGGAAPAQLGGASAQAGSAVGEAGANGGDTQSDAGAATVGGQPALDSCGNGKIDAGEDCDLGSANDAAAYGSGKCTDKCRSAPFCGDSEKNGTEVCDEGGKSVELGACNPECSGYFEKKFIRATFNRYPAGGLGGIVGADAKCVLEFGEGWKALLVGGGRRATTKPLLSDGAKDWVVQKYTYYFSYYADALIWRTDDVALLGVREGKRVNVYVDAFKSGGDYPWSGWQNDWTTFPDTSNPSQGTCAGWTSTLSEWGTFTFADLTAGQSESCATASFLLCVEQ